VCLLFLTAACAGVLVDCGGGSGPSCDAFCEKVLLCDTSDTPEPIHEARLWRDQGWTARVVKNNDDEGWAVEMIKEGEPEPALVGPWTMGRDKKNPKPLDTNAFNTLVKTASEVLRRHEQQLHAHLHKSLVVNAPAGRITVTLDVVPDEDDPHALLAAQDAAGEALAQRMARPGPSFPVPPKMAIVGSEFDDMTAPELQAYFVFMIRIYSRSIEYGG